MTYRFIWVDGVLELASGFGKIHHVQMLHKLMDDGKVSMPMNLRGGWFTQDDLHGSQFDSVKVEYRAGEGPTEEELKFLIRSELDRYTDKESMRRDEVHRIALAATVEDTEPVHNFGFMREPHKDLYSCAFEGEKMRPTALLALKNHALEVLHDGGYGDAEQWIYFTVFGSGASYNWDEEGDFDIQMWIDVTKYNESHRSAPVTSDELLADIRRIIQTINFPSFAELNLRTDDCEGKMLIQYYPKPGTGSQEENLASKPYACYDMMADEWIQRPSPIRPTFYGEMFLMLMPKAEEVAVQAEALLSELERNIINWQFWSGMYTRYHNDDYREQAEKARSDAELEREGVKNLFETIFKGRQEAYSPEGKGYEDERDMLQKLLEVWGIFQQLKHYARADLPWEEQSIVSKTAGWSQVMDKAQRLVNEGNIHVLRNGPDNAFARVDGDTGSYNTEIWRDDPSSDAITRWSCDCPWGQVSWGRTRQWKKYEGRPCAHTLALYWQTYNSLTDEAQEQELSEWQGQDVQQLMFDPGAGPEQFAQAVPQRPEDFAGPAGQAAPGQPPQPQAPASVPPAATSQPKKPGEGGAFGIPGAFSSWKQRRTSAFRHQHFETTYKWNPRGTRGFHPDDRIPFVVDKVNGQVYYGSPDTTHSAVYNRVPNRPSGWEEWKNWTGGEWTPREGLSPNYIAMRDLTPEQLEEIDSELRARYSIPRVASWKDKVKEYGDLTNQKPGAEWIEKKLQTLEPEEREEVEAFLWGPKKMLNLGRPISIAAYTVLSEILNQTTNIALHFPNMLNQTLPQFFSAEGSEWQEKIPTMWLESHIN